MSRTEQRTPRPVKNISIQGMEEMNCCATRSLEDEWEEFEVERQNYRYAKLALGQLFTTNILTETQKRRFRLNIFYGLSSREIGRIEGLVIKRWQNR